MNAWNIESLFVLDKVSELNCRACLSAIIALPAQFFSSDTCFCHINIKNLRSRSTSYEWYYQDIDPWEGAARVSGGISNRTNQSRSTRQHPGTTNRDSMSCLQVYAREDVIHTCTLTATFVPSLRVARCTCPIEAAAVGTSSNSKKCS